MDSIATQDKTNAHLAADGILRLLAAREIHINAALTTLAFLSTGILTDNPRVPSVVNGLACDLQRFVMGRTTRLSVLSIAFNDKMSELTTPSAEETIGKAWGVLREFVTTLNTVVGKQRWAAPVLTVGSFMAAGLPDTVSVMLRVPAVYVDVQASICARD